MRAFSGHVVAAEGPREHQVCRQMAGDAASRAQATQAGARDQGRVAKPVLVCGVCVCSYQEVCVCVCRDVHSVCSWDEKAAVRIQDALRNEILRFISEAQGVS